MKILLIRHLNPFFDSSASGNRFASIVKGLANQGLEVTIVVTGGYNSTGEKQRMGRHSNYDGVEVIYLLGLLNHNIWLRRIYKYLLSAVIERLILNRLGRIINNDYNYIWITIDYIGTRFLSENATRLGGSKSLIEMNEFHDIYRESGYLTNTAQYKYAHRQAQSLLDVLPKIDCFAIMTQTLMAHYKSMAKADAQFLHLPMTVDMNRFSMTPTDICTKPYIALAGSMSNRKEGIDILIRAFAIVKLQLPHIELRLAGSYHPDIQSQKALSRKLGVEDSVKYIGELSRDEIPKLFCEAKVLVLARPDSHQAQGGFPTKLGEYLATGNPVCVTRVGEIPNYLEDNVTAFMATPGDVDSFADALQRALGNEENARKVGKAGYEVAKKNFNMEVQAKRLKEFLEENLKK